MNLNYYYSSIKKKLDWVNFWRCLNQYNLNSQHNVKPIYKVNVIRFLKNENKLHYRKRITAIQLSCTNGVI